MAKQRDGDGDLSITALGPTSEAVSIAQRHADPPQPAERLRKVPGRVTDKELGLIRQAIYLRRAMLSHLDISFSDGEILSQICSFWTQAESARLSGKGGMP